MNSASPQKMILAVVVLVALVRSGRGQGKPTECCTRVSYKEITEEVVGYRVQIAHAPCLPAVIFYTNESFYCAAISAPWVRKKAAAVEKAAAAARASTGSSPTRSSLLSIITSAASAPSSSPPSSSSPSSSSSSSSSSSH